MASLSGSERAGDAPIRLIHAMILGNPQGFPFHTAEPIMTAWNPNNPCSVGDLRLPAQFQTLRWVPFHCDAMAGVRAWIHLPAGLVLSWGCPLEQGEEVEICSLGSLLLTRVMTEAEREDWENTY